MIEAHEQFQAVFHELYGLTLADKKRFLEALLFKFTIASRGIWSDKQRTHAEKIEAFKWLNELTHRIWNIWYDLRRGEENDSITRLYDNMKFYGEQSDLLRMHLVPTTLSAFENYKLQDSNG